MLHGFDYISVASDSSMANKTALGTKESPLAAQIVTEEEYAVILTHC
jgi:hypothetical protein